MTWSYDPSNVGSSNLSTVRLLIGDNSSDDQLLQDEEINWLVLSEAGVYHAAAAACDAISSSFARKVDKTVGSLSISASQKAGAYAERAKSLRHRGNARIALSIYAGGISVSDKDTVVADTDRVAPAFTRDLHTYQGSVVSSSQK